MHPRNLTNEELANELITMTPGPYNKEDVETEISLRLIGKSQAAISESGYQLHSSLAKHDLDDSEKQLDFLDGHLSN